MKYYFIVLLPNVSGISLFLLFFYRSVMKNSTRRDTFYDTRKALPDGASDGIANMRACMHGGVFTSRVTFALNCAGTWASAGRFQDRPEIQEDTSVETRSTEPARVGGPATHA